MDASAEWLLRHYGLQVGERIYELTEIELYRHDAEHPDPYAHQHPEQLLNGYWFFHRASNKPGANYRGGTFKGLDLAAGEEGCYVGILLRALYHPTTGAISGPCKVVDHLLREAGVATIADLVGEAGPLAIAENHRGLKLVRLEMPHNDDIYQGPRVGLNVSKAPEWHGREYRYVRRYPLLQKQKRSLHVMPHSVASPLPCVARALDGVRTLALS